jgi:hypothetical protein
MRQTRALCALLCVVALCAGCAGAAPDVEPAPGGLVAARPGARLRLDLEGPRAAFGARVLPARVDGERVAVTYMEDASSVMRRAELEPFEAALAASEAGVVPIRDASVPMGWRDDPGYQLLAMRGAQRAALVGVAAQGGSRRVDTVYHVLARPSGMPDGLTLAAVTARQPLMSPATPVTLEGEPGQLVMAHMGEVFREGGYPLTAGGVEVEAVSARLGAGWHMLAVAHTAAEAGGGGGALVALDASRQQRRVVLGPSAMRGWLRWELVAVTDVDADGFAEVLIHQRSPVASMGQLVLVHTRVKPSPDAAPSPYNLCPDLDAGAGHIFFCLALGAPPAAGAAAPPS